MSVAVLICVVCLLAGAAASARWLPELAPGPVGGMALIAICGLLGMALAILGLHIYEVIEIESTGPVGRFEFASAFSSMFADAGPLIGLAIAVYLLAPGPDLPEESPLPSATSETPVA
jgi:hypothetical protein